MTPSPPPLWLGALSVRDWFRVLWRFVLDFGRNDLSLMAAGVAFFAMLALFPGIAALVSFYGILADPTAIKTNMVLLKPLMPDNVYPLLDRQVSMLLRTDQSALGAASLISLVFATWSARAGITALLTGLERIGGISRERSLLRSLGLAYLMTLLLILVGIVAVVSVVFVPTILALLPLGTAASVAAHIGQWAVAILTILIGIGLVYRYSSLSNMRRPPLITPGSIVATLLWLWASLLLSAYLRNFGYYNEIYGSLGAVIALLLWFYVGAYVVLIGAELNAEAETYLRGQSKLQSDFLAQSPSDEEG